MKHIYILLINSLQNEKQQENSVLGLVFNKGNKCFIFFFHSTIDECILDRFKAQKI